MTRLLFSITFFVFWNHVSGQLPVGSWSDHLRCNTANCLAVGLKEVFASTGSSLLIYNKEFGELKKMSTVNGLTETGISAIAWSEENNTLIITYNSTNIDLLKKSAVYTIPDIMNKYIASGKRINKIRTSGRYAYLATGFGIVLVDLIKMEINDTWRPGPDSENNEVFDIALGNNFIYAATNSGVWQGDLSNQGLAWFGNWSQLKILPYSNSRYTLAIFAGNTLYVNLSDPAAEGDQVYAINGTATLHSLIPGVVNRSFDIAPEGFSITSQESLKYFKTDGSLLQTFTSFGQGTPDLSQGVIEPDYIWVADMNSGLKMSDNRSGFNTLHLSGPASNLTGSITSSEGKTIICAGGVDKSWKALDRKLQVSEFENNLFNNFESEEYHDAMRVCFDPVDNNHFFISTWGDGLLEYNNNQLTKHWDNTNSPLQSTSSGIQILGLAMDDSHNLWVTQTGVTQGVKILKQDGSWAVHQTLTDVPVLGDIISTRSGQKWIVLPGGYGICVIDDNNTPALLTDDKSKKLTVTDADGVVCNSVFSIAEDLDGSMWLGTDKGPVIYTNPDRIFENDIRGYRIKVPRNDGSGLADYMLGTETITSISVDGANRKWLGTMSSGAYLLSSDGTKMLKSYNEKNSPMYSDSIITVSINNKSGEVWFGTSKGILSVRETAISGKPEFTGVYSFPNPVREDYTGNVTITGLMRDTRVKITDVSGNLVFETISEGGQ
ncbi:MAG: hypothetical protein Q8868_12465, partial [Bacteroidota bacterium]|nr:hypothetical protein [Bacteroidota bacterium]